MTSFRALSVPSTRYEGEFVDNLRHGVGTYTEADGSTYSGEWAFGKRHGKVPVVFLDHAHVLLPPITPHKMRSNAHALFMVQGTYTSASGLVIEGWWERGVRVRGKVPAKVSRSGCGWFVAVAPTPFALLVR